MPSPRRRLLFLGHDLPWPAITGGRIRDAHLLDAAAAEWRIDAVIVAEPDILDRDRRAIPPLRETVVHAFPHEGEPTAWPCRRSRRARNAIELLCSRGVDAVHVEGSYMLDLLPSDLLARTVLVEHNIESVLLEQRRAISPDEITHCDVRIAREREEHAWRATARLVTLTEEDASSVRARRPELQPVVVPNGWDHVAAGRTAPRRSGQRSRAPRLLFYANHRYGPNRDALRWLVGDVFPLVQRAVPDAELEIAGANLDVAGSRRLDRPGITVTGPFRDVTAVLDTADVVLCPLRIGGGIKVKMIEALRRECIVVTTSIGAQGIHGALRRGLAIGDSARAFADHVIRLCDPAERAAVRKQLAAASRETPRWQDSYRRLSALWREVSVPAWTSQ